MKELTIACLINSKDKLKLRHSTSIEDGVRVAVHSVSNVVDNDGDKFIVMSAFDMIHMMQWFAEQNGYELREKSDG